MSELETAAAELADGLTALVGVLDERLGAVTAIVGPKGDKGDPGEAGADGKDGLNAVGKQGPPGKAGRDGVDGIDGVDGVGRPGKAGAKGADGPRGFDGAPGPGPVRVVVERENQLIAFAQVYLDDGSTRRMAVRRDANRRFTELVRVA